MTVIYVAIGYRTLIEALPLNVLIVYGNDRLMSRPGIESCVIFITATSQDYHLLILVCSWTHQNILPHRINEPYSETRKACNMTEFYYVPPNLRLVVALIDTRQKSAYNGGFRSRRLRNRSRRRLPNCTSKLNVTWLSVTCWFQTHYVGFCCHSRWKVHLFFKRSYLGLTSKFNVT